MNTFNYVDYCEIQNFENNAIGLYNQHIIQILCCDTLELEIELIHQTVCLFLTNEKLFKYSFAF